MPTIDQIAAAHADTPEAQAAIVAAIREYVGTGYLVRGHGRHADSGAMLHEDVEWNGVVRSFVYTAKLVSEHKPGESVLDRMGL